jgi:hypothetical protein
MQGVSRIGPAQPSTPWLRGRADAEGSQPRGRHRWLHRLDAAATGWRRAARGQGGAGQRPSRRLEPTPEVLALYASGGSSLSSSLRRSCPARAGECGPAGRHRTWTRVGRLDARSDLRSEIWPCCMACTRSDPIWACDIRPELFLWIRHARLTGGWIHVGQG